MCEYDITTAVYADGTTKQFITVGNIPPYMFANQDIVDVLVSKDVTSISENAFANCTSLSSISIQSNIQNISQDAFANCKAL